MNRGVYHLSLFSALAMLVLSGEATAPDSLTRLTAPIAEPLPYPYDLPCPLPEVVEPEYVADNRKGRRQRLKSRKSGR